MSETTIGCAAPHCEMEAEHDGPHRKGGRGWWNVEDGPTAQPLRAESERERELEAALVRLTYPSGAPFTERGRIHVCPVCGGHELWPWDDGRRVHLRECWLGPLLAPSPTEEPDR